MPDTRQYIKEGGVNCVYCQSSKVRTINKPTLQEGGSVVQDVACDMCGHGWMDVYELTSVVLTEED
jgi:hypothetical protein